MIKTINMLHIIRTGRER